MAFVPLQLPQLLDVTTMEERSSTATMCCLRFRCAPLTNWTK